MALWQAVSDRYELLAATWNSGRAGVTERERMATLIWGRLDATIDPGLLAGTGGGARPSGPAERRRRRPRGSFAGSVPPLRRAAVAAQGAVGPRPHGAVTTEQIRRLRAQMERIREQIDLEPAGSAQQAAAERQSRMARRLREITDAKAGRGGDVGGLLGPLEIEAATFERDVIVAASRPLRRRERGNWHAGKLICRRGRKP